MLTFIILVICLFVISFMLQNKFKPFKIIYLFFKTIPCLFSNLFNTVTSEYKNTPTSTYLILLIAILLIGIYILLPCFIKVPETSECILRPELWQAHEGIARELISRIQNIRKSSGFNVTDKIEVKIKNHPKLNAPINNNLNYILGEILATKLYFSDDFEENDETIEFDGIKTVINLKKV